MKNLWRYSGHMLAAIGVIHLIVWLVLGWQMAENIVADGIVNTIKPAPDFENVARAALWYGGIWTGVLIILLGLFVRYHTHSTGRTPPRHLSVVLLLLSALGCLIEPQSGAWMVAAVALIMVMAPQPESDCSAKTD